MEKNCNEFDVNFDPCEDFKTVKFNIYMEDIDDIIFNEKHKFCKNMLDSSSCSTKSNMINIIIFAVLIKLLYSSLNRDCY